MSIEKQCLGGQRFFDDAETVKCALLEFRFAWEWSVRIETNACFVNDM